MTTDGSDIRGEVSQLSTVTAIKLVLAYRELSSDCGRLLAMIDWLLERQEPTSDDTVSVALLLAAIKATNGSGATER